MTIYYAQFTVEDKFSKDEIQETGLNFICF